MSMKAASLTSSLLVPKGAAIPTGVEPSNDSESPTNPVSANEKIAAAVARPFHSSQRNSKPVVVAHQAKIMRMQSRRASKPTHKARMAGLGKTKMLKAQDSLEFILNRIQELGRGTQPHERAAYRALIHMIQRWAEPTDLFIDENLQMAERIGQDLADITRHIHDVQHAYMNALFTERK